MKVLIIYAHPESQGFSSFILEESKRYLSDNSIDFEVIDLYKIGYDPVLKNEELYTAGNKYITQENIVMQEKISKTDGLIFIYPVWWGGMPAILKGFMDRVFTPGFAFKYRKNKIFKFIPDRLLDNKKISVFITSGGPWFAYKAILDPIKILNRFIIFGTFCKNIKTYQIYGASFLNEKHRNKIKITVKRGISRII